MSDSNDSPTPPLDLVCSRPAPFDCGDEGAMVVVQDIGSPDNPSEIRSRLTATELFYGVAAKPRLLQLDIYDYHEDLATHASIVLDDRQWELLREFARSIFDQDIE